MPDTPSRAARLGALAFLLRPTYIATEVVTAAATTGRLQLRLRLGQQARRGRLLGGLLLAAARADERLLHRLRRAPRRRRLLLAKPLGPWVTGLLVVSGVSSFATGLAPLDQDADAARDRRDAPLHRATAGAAPARPPPARRSPGLAKALLATGVVTAAAAVGFILSGDERAAGALERLALWPVLFGLAGFAWGHRPGMGRPRPRGTGSSLRRSCRVRDAPAACGWRP